TQELETNNNGADQYSNQQEAGKPTAQGGTLRLIGVLDGIACFGGGLLRRRGRDNRCRALFGTFFSWLIGRRFLCSGSLRLTLGDRFVGDRWNDLGSLLG